MLAFFLTPIGLRLAAGFGLLALVGAADAYIAVHEYNKGWHAAIAAVAKRDQEALDAVSKSRSEVDACFASGRTWSVVDGVCQ